MITLTDHAEGIVLPVRAQAGARANAIRGLYEGALKVAVTQVAEKGKANKALVQVLCQQLELRRSQVSLLTGQTAADKQFLVRDITREELVRRIASAVPREDGIARRRAER